MLFLRGKSVDWTSKFEVQYLILCELIQLINIQYTTNNHLAFSFSWFIKTNLCDVECSCLLPVQYLKTQITSVYSAFEALQLCAIWIHNWRWQWVKWFSLAIVTLKHGEEAESAVSELCGVPLRGCDVQISLYRSDNLLCVTALPPTLCSDDAAFKTFAETFGPVEKCFLMRYSSGLFFQDFVFPFYPITAFYIA